MHKPFRPGDIAWEVWEGRHLVRAAFTEADAIEQAMNDHRGPWVQPPIAVPSLVMPDRGRATSPPWAGGTWGGKCGATKWIADPEFQIVFVQDSTPREERTGQAQHANWVEQTRWFPIEKRAEKAAGGFRIACMQPMRHEGVCEAGVWRWTFEHTAVGIENMARRTGVQTLPLAL